MATIIYNCHKVETPGLSITGKEEIKYDGQVVSSKHSMLGATHVFIVQEGFEKAQYEVEISARWHGFSASTTVRRNGIVIFTDK